MDKEQLSKYMAKIGSRGGKKSSQGMSKAQRSERARKAAQARYQKAGKQ